MRTLLIITLVVAVIAVFVNDAGRYGNTRYDLSKVTEDVADAVASSVGGKTRDQAAAMAAAMALKSGFTVYQYDQDKQGIRVWTEATVPGTWVLGPFMAWRAGKPLGTPLVIRDYAASVYR
jgi:hypothetical protein